jgi:MtN3 and saliva related transmembrane protein
VIQAIGSAAGPCSMTSFVPQLVKIAREKHADGVSLNTYLVMVAGFILWVVYGVLLKSWPVAASNAVNLVLSATILALKFRIERKDRKS